MVWISDTWPWIKRKQLWGVARYRTRCPHAQCKRVTHGRVAFDLGMKRLPWYGKHRSAMPLARFHPITYVLRRLRGLTTMEAIAHLVKPRIISRKPSSDRAQRLPVACRGEFKKQMFLNPRGVGARTIADAPQQHTCDSSRTCIDRVEQRNLHTQILCAHQAFFG